MVDWHNPSTIVAEYTAWVKLLHVIDGVYLWEFICNLSFEWSLLRGRRQWRWTAAFYIACRLATIAEVVSNIVGFDVTSPINCKIWSQLLALFVYAAGTLSLSLYAVRSVAVWQRSLLITIISGAIILANFGAWIRRIVQADAVWNPQTMACLRIHTDRALLNNMMLLSAEVIFFVLMASGIYYRNPGPRAFRIMCREGLLWLVVAILVQIIPTSFLLLNLNDVMNVMFITPSVVCTSIGATRMYRTLSDRQAGNLLDFWETSRDEMTGEIRFRRQTQFITPSEAQNTEAVTTTALPMGRLVRSQPQLEERYVERFEARDIELDDDSLTIKDAKPSITADDKSETEWETHAK
ncbi:hypothetical protein BGW80DRAFT_1301098 [Lactifluus volemus]|nr:hypothetical protein BGW80DRAFT_1301098 [Lactifluus volemus]